MGDVISPGAVVRPRVVLRPEEGPRLLEDVVAELADELPPGLVWLVGGPGGGKSTAISYLATFFGDDDRVALLDEPTRDEFASFAEAKLVIAACTAPRDLSGVVLRLLKWGSDDLVEYLLAAHPNRCKSVMQRVGPVAGIGWNPELACVVLGGLAADAAIADPQSALKVEIENRLTNPTQRAVAAEFCFARAVKNYDSGLSSAFELSRVGCPQRIISLMRHEEVQLPLAAEALMTTLTTQKSLRKLLPPLPGKLVQLVSAMCRGNQRAVKRLRGILHSQNSTTVHPMSASILALADPTWRPAGDKDHACRFQAGIFRDVNWSQAGLAHANLRTADFTGANLVRANLVEADAIEANFSAGDLSGARLIGLRAARANFGGAKLASAKLALLQAAHANFAGADLTGANLVKADLSAADLSDANFSKADLYCAGLIGSVLEGTNFSDAKLDEAYLTQADLRTAIFDRTSFHGAYMTHVQMEDVVLSHARFEGAHLDYAQLTGSKFPSANLRGAKLTFAQLAEIDWPGADLRSADLFGASFHMGSSRSGLVGSPIACEGSKTGFYTDDREEMNFKRPEEIRKANLCGADLRGARIDNVDFYLVDLRGARLNPGQEAQARRTGAILDDWESC